MIYLVFHENELEFVILVINHL